MDGATRPASSSVSYGSDAAASNSEYNLHGFSCVGGPFLTQDIGAQGAKPVDLPVVFGP